MRALAVLLACALCLKAQAQVIYAGFDHILAFDKEGKATAWDYRRNMRPNSTCDIVGAPPLVKGATVEDWIQKGVSAVSTAKPTQYTYMGYELYMSEQKDTGAYVLRRCRDFRPQLTELPCEAFVTGFADMLKSPYKTVFLGNSRVMFLNTVNGEYSVYPFDADVHTGGDPFKFGTGSLFEGLFPITAGLEMSNIAHVKIAGSTDLLLVQAGDGRTIGYEYDGRALKGSPFKLKPVMRINTAWNTTLTSLGEDRILSYNTDRDYEVRSVYYNVTDFKTKLLHSGNLGGGTDCLLDNATACVKRTGCAWCPSTYTCHNYDMKSKMFCDRHTCGAAPIVETLGENPLAMVVVPDCTTDPDMEHADIIDTLDSGLDKLLPGNKRMDPMYRKNAGEHANAEASPIHFSVDNELGDDPVVIPEEEDATPDLTIQTNNKVSQGQVFTPPLVSSSSPCMDDRFNPLKLADGNILVPMKASVRMNHPETFDGEQADVLTRSPLGEANSTLRKVDCVKRLKEGLLPKDAELTLSKILSPLSYADIAKTFNRFDTVGVRNILTSELGEILRTINVNAPPADSELELIVNAFDSDQRGSVSYESVLEKLNYALRGRMEAEYKKMTENAFAPSEPVRIPKSNQSRVERYLPDNGGTFAEEGIMNGDEEHGALAAQWIEPSLSKSRGDAFPVNSPIVPERGELQFRPHEPALPPPPKPPKAFVRPPQPRKTTEDLMEMGVVPGEDPKISGADCTDTGGDDAIASAPMTKTMGAVVTDTMPRSLDAQLALFEDEEKKIVDWMPAPEPDTQINGVGVGVQLPEANKGDRAHAVEATRVTKERRDNAVVDADPADNAYSATYAEEAKQTMDQLVAVMQSLDKETLMSNFNFFDADKDGSIDAQELKELLRALGLNGEPHVLSGIIAKFDLNKNGKVEAAEVFATLRDLAAGREKKTKQTRDELVRVMNAMDKDALLRNFNYYDTDKDGSISMDELKEVIKALGINTDAAVLDAIISEMDLDKNGKVDAEEVFNMMRNVGAEKPTIRDELVAVMSTFDKETIMTNFNYFDTDQDGSINKDELKGVLKAIGIDANDSVLDSIISEFDLDENGKVEAEEVFTVLQHLDEERMASAKKDVIG